MIWIRTTLIAFPVLLLVLLGGSFLSVKVTPAPKKNEMITGSIGEAKVLNPIQSSTSADSEITSRVFGSLLKYDENLQITGDHAKSWKLAQQTTLYFQDAAQATAALSKINAVKERWKSWNLESVKQEATSLQLSLSLPGTQSDEEIAGLLGTDTLVPIQTFRIKVRSGIKESIDRLKEKFRYPICRIWFDTDSACEISVSSADKRVQEDLKNFYQSYPESEITPLETLTHLDEPEITFDLYENIRWHDGTPFTAEDVAFTYRMIMDERIASPRRPDYELISSVEVLSPYRVKVTYRKPYSPALSSWMIGLLPKHLLEGKPSTWWAEYFNRAPVGTGPFKFKEWKTGEFITLEKNTDYFEGSPHLDEIVIRVIPDPVSLRLSFETEQIDFWGVSQHAVGGFEKDPRFVLYASPAPSYDYIGWNIRRAPFDDIRVRQALAHAVNIESIIRYVLYGYGQQSTGIFAPQMWFYNTQIKPFAYDPERAKAMLAEAGWKPGSDGILTKDGKRFSFTLITNQGNEIRKDIATLVQADFKKIGIEVKVQIYEFAVFISKYVNTGDFDAVVLGWSLGYDYDQYQLWHSSQTNPGQLNFVGYKNKQADQLIETLRTTYDTKAIQDIAGKLQEIIYRDQPYLFLYVPNAVTAMWKDRYRVLRPAAEGWKDEPVHVTKAGFSIYSDWFYRLNYKPVLKP